LKYYLKHTIYLIRIVFLSLLIVIIYSCNTEKNDIKRIKDKNLVTDTKEEGDTAYAIIMTGDIMMGTNYPYSSSLPPDDGKYLFDSVKEHLRSGDVTIGNLEGTLLDKGGTPKICDDSSNNCAWFRMPERYSSYLKDAGFDIMSVANNHSGDMGDIGRKSTVRALGNYGISFAGYAFCPTSILNKDGLKFGFTAFAPNTGTQDLLDLKSAIKTVKHLCNNSDIVIVSFHGGAEGTGAAHVPRQTEYYLGEKRGDVYEFAHEMIDAGADIVFGHGPHVARGIELYKDRIIAYSLGNFCTYGKFGLSGALGLAPILKVYLDKSGVFLHGRIFPVKQIKRGFPVIDEGYKVVELIRSLSIKDFPESELEILDDGKIVKK